MTETKMQLVDWLDDLCVRFIINLPQEELESVERICFQVEEAQWYYEDFIRPLDPELPSLNLRNFCLRIFQHCPLLSEFSPYHHATAFEEFLAYKTRVPVRGAIMLNQDMDQVILVKGWKKGANWSFPRGKINKDETDLACAVREVYEETGYHVEAAGLVGAPDGTKYIDVAIQHQHIRLYVFRGVPMDTHFEARTRKEISKIDWWRLSDLPTLKKKKQQQEGRGEDLALNANKFYMVAPFLVPLKKWISQQKRLGKSSSVGHIQHPIENAIEELPLAMNGERGDGANPTSEDLGRLLASLRQPPAESNVKPSSEFDTESSADAATLQLKNLLRVPTEHSTEFKAPSSTQESKASTLLALLRGGPSKTQHPEPQTPFEPVAEASTVPGSPKPQHVMEPRLSTLPPPPVFAIHPKRDDQTLTDHFIVPNAKTANPRAAQDQRASINAWNTFENTSAKQEAERKRMLADQRAREEQTGIRYEPRLPVMNETFRQVKVQDTAGMDQPEQRHVVNILKRSVGGLAQSNTAHQLQQSAKSDTATPYQVTSNVEPSDKTQYQDIYRPTIPAANKLPMPKITSHSSSLLDLFRNGQIPKNGQTLEQSTGSPIPATRLQTAGGMTTDSNINKHRPGVPGEAGTSGLTRPPTSTLPSKVQQTGDAKLPQSTHQASLLEIFRKPSVSAVATTPPPQTTLDVPVEIVELSAMPSPSQSKHISKANSGKRQEISSAAVGGPNYQRKKKNAKHGNLPVSATVNGPLNVPQFEMVARKVETSGNQKRSSVQEVKKSPVTILARPSTAKANEQIGLPESTAPDDYDAKAPTPRAPAPTGPKSHVELPHGPRRFQPQILRRPPASTENPRTQQPPTMQSSTRLSNGERDSPSPVSGSDQVPAMKPDQKATLLSLFTKSSSRSHSPQSISRPDFSAFVSPIATKPPTSFPLLSERMSPNVRMTVSSPGKGRLPSTGQGSEALPPSAGISRINSTERQPPTKKTTNDVDRNFLLGYLNGVAKKEGR
ncbi:MAG: hypothetical protein Q9169_005863 [Polycauliona sp. 2 TL-2023]